jgi:hypothetical protein
MSSEPSASKRHVSELPDPRQRFLARVVDHALSERARTADDFLRHFPPPVIVSSLARADELRVRLLVAATGTHEKIALKKSVASAVEDLELALAEQTTTAAALVGLYSADDKVRYLDARKLWSFVVEDEFFKAGARSDPGQVEQATQRLVFIVECALSEGVLSLRDVADAVSFDEIAAALPAAEAREVVKYALSIARAGSPLTEEKFLSVVPLPTLIAHLPLERTFQRVVVNRIAEPNGLVDASAHVDAAPSPEAALVAPASPVITEAAPEPPVEFIEAKPAASSDPHAAPDEDDVRKRVIDRLRTIDRLPPSNTDLSTPVLLSIESMYADLWAVNDDDEREAAIRESFPNETLLRTAMLALIEQLDPSVDTHDPIIRDADVSGLMKIVLFEERRRRDVNPSSSNRRGATPAPNRGRRTVPPPLPRSSTPPPLPGEGRVSPPPLPTLEASKRDN